MGSFGEGRTALCVVVLVELKTLGEGRWAPGRPKKLRGAISTATTASASATQPRWWENALEDSLDHRAAVTARRIWVSARVIGIAASCGARRQSARAYWRIRRRRSATPSERGYTPKVSGRVRNPVVM